jgi:hypothetical protein
MLDSSLARMFRLRRGGVHCDRDGLYVGPVALLTATKDATGAASWAPRSESDLNDELSACYGLPIDCAAKRGGLAGVATALDRGDVALAGIAALLLRFPDPPSLEKDASEPDGILTLAAELFWSGLLKGDWDPSKHPRTGEPPNRGWFASVPNEAKEGGTARRGWPPPRVNRALRDLFERLSKRAGLLDLGPAGEAALAFLEIVNLMTPEELNEGEDRLTAQWKAALDPPKTLEELQEPPIENVQGYEQHHIVEQNPSNVEKREVEKFGQEALDDPSNLVWIPRLKHEQITAFYNSKPVPGGPTQREIIGKMEFDQQRAIGLELLREEGVLQ